MTVIREVYDGASTRCGLQAKTIRSCFKEFLLAKTVGKSSSIVGEEFREEP
jgi:hypothetical protein